MAKVHNGIVLYDIQLNGCHNAVYANEQAPDAGVIFSETIRKKSQDNEIIAGDYDCFYFDPGNARRDAEVRIVRRNGTENVFDVSWTLVGQATPAFTGIGYQMNARQFAVHYKSA